MKRTITISVDQLYRPSPGGIATYVRGLATGLAALHDSNLHVRGLAPRGALPHGVPELPLELNSAPVGVTLLTRLWPRWPLGVPADSNVVHATSMAGPFGGGAKDALHSVALHDLLWRDEPSAATPAGIRFHEERLKLIIARDDLRVIVTSPGLAGRLVALGIDRERLHTVRLGVDEDVTDAASPASVSELLGEHGVRGPFTLYVGTREPRKNLEALIEAHRRARATNPSLGDLVLAGPSGWGAVPTADATVLGLVSRPLLRGLYRDATVFAYVPIAEGWGLPPVEALHAGTRVVASVTTPSTSGNLEVIRVDPSDVDSIAEGLVAALSLPDDVGARSERHASVSDLTWLNVALDHLAAWQ
jgi:glycosyltransferase involved in cell wall biosynthesis